MSKFVNIVVSLFTTTTTTVTVALGLTLTGSKSQAINSELSEESSTTIMQEITEPKQELEIRKETPEVVPLTEPVVSISKDPTKDSCESLPESEPKEQIEDTTELPKPSDPVPVPKVESKVVVMSSPLSINIPEGDYEKAKQVVEDLSKTHNIDQIKQYLGKMTTEQINALTSSSEEDSQNTFRSTISRIEQKLGKSQSDEFFLPQLLLDEIVINAGGQSELTELENIDEELKQNLEKLKVYALIQLKHVAETWSQANPKS